jgi:hypothetical protein
MNGPFKRSPQITLLRVQQRSALIALRESQVTILELFFPILCVSVKRCRNR